MKYLDLRKSKEYTKIIEAAEVIKNRGLRKSL